jgi:biotin carboxylase
MTTSPSADRPLLVLVRSSPARHYREYLLQTIAPHFRLWLLHDREPTWEAPYLAGHSVVDTTNAAAMTDAAASLAPVGVLCWDEPRIVAAAQVAQALGLPGNGPEVIRRCRDKQQTRAALAAAGVAQPASIPALTVAQARAAADRIGYPLVIKPRALNGSRGVARVDRPQDLEAALRNAALAATPDVVDEERAGVLVEEYVDGPEVSVDSAICDGRATIAFVARKQLGFPPYFEEVGHVLNARDPLLMDSALHRMVHAVHDAVGFRTGWTHSEFRLTSAGPRLIEINARLGGDRIPYLAQLALGIEPGTIAARIACGFRVSIAPTRRRVAGVRFAYPPEDTLVRSVHVDTAQLPPEVDCVETLVLPGQEARLPPGGHVSGRLALITALSDSSEQCTKALDAAARAITVEALGRRPRRDRVGARSRSRSTRAEPASDR